MPILAVSECALIPDEALVQQLEKLAGEARGIEAVLLIHLAEMDARRLALARGFPSLFAFCVEILHFSEGTACRRIAAARALRRFPSLLPRLEAGGLKVTALAKLAPLLTDANHDSVLEQAAGLSTRELEYFLAELKPIADVKDQIRKLPEPQSRSKAPASLFTVSAGGSSEVEVKTLPPPPTSSAKSRDQIRPTAPSRVTLKFSASADLAEAVRRAQDLLAHRFPDGRLEDIVGAALEALLEKVDPDRKNARREDRATRAAAIKDQLTPKDSPVDDDRRPRATISRYVPAAQRAKVWSEAGGQCEFVSPDGRRCRERRALQFDHVRPFALGGPSDSSNGRMYCRGHNAYAARQSFGVVVYPKAPRAKVDAN